MCVFKHFNLFVSFVGNFIKKNGKVIFAFFPKFSETLTQNLITPNSFFEKMSLKKIVLKFDFPIKKWCLKRFHDGRWIWCALLYSVHLILHEKHTGLTYILDGWSWACWHGPDGSRSQWQRVYDVGLRWPSAEPLQSITAGETAGCGSIAVLILKSLVANPFPTHSFFLLTGAHIFPVFSIPFLSTYNSFILHFFFPTPSLLFFLIEERS